VSDDFPELDHIATVEQARTFADALLERSRGAAESIQLEVRGDAGR
jgi:hypothetical protein